MDDNRAAMMRRLQELAFALQESALFLDTHPEDREALAFHNEKLACHRELKQRYAALFGPLCPYTADQPTWRWAEGPWPWQ